MAAVSGVLNYLRPSSLEQRDARKDGKDRSRNTDSNSALVLVADSREDMPGMNFLPSS